MTLVRVTCPRFVAGFEYDSAADRVIRTAPILRRVLGKSRREVWAIARSRGWALEKVDGEGNRP